MIKKFIKDFVKWLAKLVGIEFESPFEIVDNLDIFVKEKLNLMLKDAESFDIATGYFQISAWEAFAQSVEKLLKKGGKVRLLIGNIPQFCYLPPSTAKLFLYFIEHPQIEIKTIKPRLLHAKLFMAKNKHNLKILYGSSNITLGGIEENIEFNIYEILEADRIKAKVFTEWYENLWETGVEIDEELKTEILLASQKEQVCFPPYPVEDLNKALFLSLLIKDLARVDLRDIGNFAPLRFQYMDAVAGVNRFFFQPGGKRGLMFAHEVGLGKTIITGMILKHLLFHKYIKNVLIIAPLSIIRQWREDLRNKFSLEPLEISSRIISKGFVPSDFNVYIISYDLLKEHIDNFYKHWDFIVIDESHFIRNKQTLRFKAVKKLSSKFYLLLTATPMHNKIDDIVTQLYLFVPEEIISKATKREILKVDREKLFKIFIKRRLQEKELKDIVSERKVLPPESIPLSDKEKELYKKLRDFLSKDSKYYQIISRNIEYIAPFVKIRYLEEFISSKEALLYSLNNLKENINNSINNGFIEFNFGLLRKESEGLIIDEISSFIEDKLEAESEIENFRDEEGNLIVRLYIDEKIREELKNDCVFLDNFINEVNKIDQFSKVKKVIELIEKLNPSEEKKIVVFVGFVKTGEALVKNLQEKGIKSEFFYGELGESKREELVKRLWSNDEDRIDVLVSTDAAYVGLNLQIADTVIHHDFPWNPMIVEQRIGRIHRIGQNKPITSYSFLCKDTLDERKHKILTEKLEKITTHLEMSYLVVRSEVAFSSEIERIMAEFEFNEIDEKTLEEKFKNHITEREEIFELLKELPSEEVEIVQIGFTNNLIQEIEYITKELLKIGKKLLNFKIKTIPEDKDFFIINYYKNGETIKELSTLKEKAIFKINKEELKRWKEIYDFKNETPYYIGPFHHLIEKISDLLIKENYGKFFKKQTSEESGTALYVLLPLKINNFTANIEVSFNIFLPILYEHREKEIEINAQKIYEMAISFGKVEEITESEKGLIEEAKEVFYNKLNEIKNKIKADIYKVRIELEELALQKHREELERKIDKKLQELDNLNKEINRKRNSGLNYKKEIEKAKQIKEELMELQKEFEKVPQSSLNIEFEEPNLIGGCIYYT